MSNSLLPNFLVIGAAKSGTTSLHAYLRQHPNIFMPRHKEIHFFVGDDEPWGTWNRGVDWYASLFERAKRQTMRGEASPGYSLELQTEISARKIRDILGAPKLIYFVREPVDRLRSHYLEYYYGYAPPNEPALDEIIFNRGRPREAHYALYCDFVASSLYNRQLARILRYHKLQNIFIRTQEEFRSNRRQVMRETFEFLGVDPSFASFLREDDRNITAEKRKRVYDPVKPLRQFGWYPGVSGSFPELLKRGFRRLTSKKLSNAELTYISDENMDHLLSLFEADAREFYRSTGVRIPIGSRLAFQHAP